MKYYLSILLFFCVKVLWAQSQDEILQTQISIDVKQKPIKDVLNTIEQELNITFSYNNSILNTDSIISILAVKDELDDILKVLLPPNTSFILSSNNIILYRISSEQKKIELKESDNNKIIIEKLDSNEKKEVFATVNKPVPVQIRPVLIKKSGSNSLDKLRDTFTIIKVSSLLVKMNNEIVKSEDKITSNKMRKSFKMTARQKDINLLQRKKSVVYSISAFYQVLNESIQYDNFAIGDSNDYIKKIIYSSEESSTSFRTGITATVTFYNVRITTGLALQKSIENYNYEDILNYRYKNDLDTIGNNSFIIDTADFSLVGKNIYRYLSVPIFVGYEWNLTRNFIVSGNIGVWINILNDKSGYYLDLTSEPMYIFNDLNKAPINKIKTDLAVDISLEYKIFKNTFISFSTSYMHPLTSIFSEDYPVTKYKSALGYNFALIQKF